MDFFLNSWQIRQSVRQGPGGVLSAYLFTYYIDNILQCVFKEDVGCRIGINKFNIFAYADDMMIMSPPAGGPRILLNVINDCINDHKLLINVNKTKFMVFRNKRKYVFNDLSFYLNGTILENVSSFKYLGCILNFDLDDSLDILKGLSSFNKSFGFLFHKFYSLEPGIFFIHFSYSSARLFMALNYGFTDLSVENLLINWPSRTTVLWKRFRFT